MCPKLQGIQLDQRMKRSGYDPNHKPKKQAEPKREKPSKIQEEKKLPVNTEMEMMDSFFLTQKNRRDKNKNKKK